MPSRRPGSVTAAGVMAIIYGSLFTLCGLCGLTAQATGNNFMVGDPKQAELQKEFQKEFQQALERDVPGYQVIQAIVTVVSLSMAVIMFIGGIGLLYMRQWARHLVLAGCLIAIANTLFQVTYQAVLVMPVMTEAFEVALPKAMPQMPQAGPQAADVLKFMKIVVTAVAVGAVIINVVLVVYLAIIVFLLCRRHVRTAFAEPRHDRPDERLLEGEDRPRDEFSDDPNEDWRTP
jgi:hypothetical protein